MENAKSEYEGKFFYEVLKGFSKDQITLIGPLETIRFVTPETANSEYKYAEVVEGVIRRVFSEDQILVTNRKL